MPQPYYIGEICNMQSGGDVGGFAILSAILLFICMITFISAEQLKLDFTFCALIEG